MDTNEQVLDFIKTNPHSNKAAIAAVTGIKGLPLFNLLKKMQGDGQITANGEGQETTYSISETEGVKPVTDEQVVVEDTPQSQVNIAAKAETGEQKKESSTKAATPKEDNQTTTTVTTSRDNSKYKFNGEEYGKGPLVRAVIAKYVEDNPDATHKQLKEIFPDTLMKRFGVWANESDAKKLSANKPLYFLKAEQMIKIKGQKEPIAVCNQWTAALIEPFIKVAKELGYKIK